MDHLKRFWRGEDRSDPEPAALARCAAEHGEETAEKLHCIARKTDDPELARLAKQREEVAHELRLLAAELDAAGGCRGRGEGGGTQ